MREKARSLMRLLPNSVVVCTSAAPVAPATHVTDPHAMTISSLASVSLGGEHGKPPVMSFNVRTPSHTLDAIMASRCFNIHVLAGDHTGAAVANWFSRPRAGALTSSSEAMALKKETGCVVDNIATAGAHSSPMLCGDGIMYVVQCRLLEDEGQEAVKGQSGQNNMAEKDSNAHGLPRPAGGLVRVRDHVVVFGEILDIVEDNTVSGSSTKAARDPTNAQLYGLAYVDRHYAGMSHNIETGPEAARGKDE